MRVLGIALALLAALGSLSVARGQGVCPMGQPQPTPIRDTAVTLANSQICSFLVFSATQPVTVTAPKNLSRTFVVTLMSAGRPVTIQPASGVTINGQASATLTALQPVTFWSDGSNYWMTNAFGQAAPPFATTNVIPGSYETNSPAIVLPNGVLQFTNAASFPTGRTPPFAVCQYSPNRQGYPPMLPGWLRVIDNTGKLRYLPVC